MTPPPPERRPAGLQVDAALALVRRSAATLVVPQAVLAGLAFAVVAIVVAVGFLLLGHVSSSVDLRRDSTVFGDSELVRKTVYDPSGGQELALTAIVAVAVVVLAVVALAGIALVARAAAAEPRTGTTGGEAPVVDPDAATGPVGLRALAVGALRDARRLAGTAALFVVVVLVGLAVAGAVGAVGLLASTVLAALLGLAVLVAVLAVLVRLALWPFVVLESDDAPRGTAALRASWGLTEGAVTATATTLLVCGVVALVPLFLLGVLFQVLAGGAFALTDAAQVGGMLAALLVLDLAVVVLVLALAPALAVAHRSLRHGFVPGPTALARRRTVGPGPDRDPFAPPPGRPARDA